jgi:hypothetical protein
MGIPAPLEFYFPVRCISKKRVNRDVFLFFLLSLPQQKYVVKKATARKKFLESFSYE